MLCPLSDCPLGLKGDLCCIYCKEKERGCPEACEKRNKSCAGIDRDEVYCKITGETVTQDIATITRSQVRNLLEG